MYKGHIKDAFNLEDINYKKCGTCGVKDKVRMVLVDFNNRELAIECTACGQGSSLSHVHYSTEELEQMLDIVKERRWLVERIGKLAQSSSDMTVEELRRIFMMLDSSMPGE